MPHDGLIRSPHPASSLLLPIKPTRRVRDVSAVAMRVPTVVALVLSLSSISWPSTIPVSSNQSLPNGLGQTMEPPAVPVGRDRYEAPATTALKHVRRRKDDSWSLPAKPLHPFQPDHGLTPLLDLRVLSAVNHESEYSDCQNTRDDSNQCCRIHRMYPPFSQISCIPKTP
jgi:hypothetical protein